MARRPPAAKTALGPMVIVAVEQHYPPAQRLLHDDLAERLLPPGMRLMVRMCRWRSPRDLLIRLTEKQAPGVWGGIACRKRYIDQTVSEAIEAGVEAVVNLGAGLDTRVYRLVAPAGVRAYEVDLPANVADKRRRLQALYGRVPDHVTLVGLDFQTQDLGQALAAHGFRIGQPAMFIWEGVTQYLTEDAVRATLEFLANAAPGSRLALTYVRDDFLDGTNLYGGERIYKDYRLKHRVWHFGIAPERVGGLLGEYGWTEREHLGAAEYITRCVHPTGRSLPVSEIERCVHAERR